MDRPTLVDDDHPITRGGDFTQDVRAQQNAVVFTEAFHGLAQVGDLGGIGTSRWFVEHDQVAGGSELPQSTRWR